MSPFTTWILNLTIWTLTAAGLFFGLRGWLRRRTERKKAGH
jgi:hypothetical protein